ncbi:amino acid synthesis family protein [Roseovarius sp. SCSIO 43702]|uniref:amino acid synthesis family protein n=1 Tax=Roseovarius sp. SCSIO 43702 TaxID=2823043 RepID=UPI001C731B6F|nr:amino acid synthesis family protein [Roseovarius sp. SCSIO 43702]QYX55981.1 amino acid synthesis family protein [Roseovarius sp. SCSIO 43702]
MPVEIRRTLTLVQTTHKEGWKEVAEPTTLVAAMAIIRNPWFGRGHVEDLGPEIREHGPVLGQMLTDMILTVTGDRLEGYGKASVTGIGGENEHGQGLTHSLWFGNRYREAVGAKSYLVFSNTRGGPGTALVIPLMHKDDGGKRSHYQTIHTVIPDAPADDEIVVALGASIGGHPNHRIGDRYADLREMGHDVDNPAGV